MVMSMVKNFFKKTLIAVCVLFLILAILVSCYIWYFFYDVSGLKLYKNEPIRDIVISYGRVYLITDNGNGYVGGEYNRSDNRKYRNALGYTRKALNNAAAPVLFFDGQIKRIFPDKQDFQRIYFTDEQDNLYELYDFNVTKKCEKIIYATRVHDFDLTYAIDTDNRLVIVEEDCRVLLQNVTMVEVFRSKIYVLLQNGDLCEFKGGELSSPIFSSVQKFDVIDVSFPRPDDNDPVLNDSEVTANSIFNVLTTDGSLYAKGTYNPEYSSVLNGRRHEPYVLEDWTLLGTNVVDFSLAGMGTVFMYSDNCAYYGFDSSSDEKLEFGLKILNIKDPEAICATSRHICIENDDGFYFMGNMFELFFDRMSEEHNIITGVPYFLEK